MKYYELLYIIPATENLEAVRARVHTIVEGQGMEVLRHEEAGRFKLSYSMRHIRQGVYHLMVFRGEPRSVFLIETALRLERNILRAMITASSETALKRPINLATFQEPVLEKSEAPRRRAPRQTFRRAPVSAPASAGTAAVKSEVEQPETVARPMSSDEIDQQIDKILEEKVL